MPIVAEDQSPLTPAKMAAYIGARVTETDDLAEYARVLRIGIEQVEDRCGPLEEAQESYTVRPNGPNLVLPVTRLRGTIVVTDAHGTQVEPAAVNRLSGIVTLHQRPAKATDEWTVSVTPDGDGSSPIPDSLVEAVFVIGAHVFNAQRGRQGRPQPSGRIDPDPPVPSHFAVPARAVELMKPYRRRRYAS